jgi:hypothetical protein
MRFVNFMFRETGVGERLRGWHLQEAKWIFGLKSGRLSMGKTGIHNKRRFTNGSAKRWYFVFRKLVFHRQPNAVPKAPV